MENASEALKMAGAMLIFVVALTITIISFTSARQASDSIVSTYGELTTFYDYELYQTTGSYREVKSDEIIANLYSYYQTNNTILFYYLKSGSYDRVNKTFSSNAVIERMTLYYTPTSNTVTAYEASQGRLSNLQKSFLRTENSKTDRKIYGLDIQDETITRNEAWKGTAGDAKIFIDCLVSGKDYENSNVSKANYDSESSSHTYYANGKLTIKFQYMSKLGGKPLNQASDCLFIERDGEYVSTTKTVEDKTTTDEEKKKNSWKDVIANSTENLNDEVLENNTATTKKVIQYIYIP